MSREHSKGRKKGIFLLIVLVILGGLAFFVLTAKDETEKEKALTFECNAERVEYLNRLGHIVEPDPESRSIDIPSEADEAFAEYNELMREQGFDLMPYSGKKVTMYSYRILNYPDIAENIYANLIFDDHLMIGADITCNDAEEGFTKPLIQMN